MEEDSEQPDGAGQLFKRGQPYEATGHLQPSAFNVDWNQYFPLRLSTYEGSGTLNLKYFSSVLKQQDRQRVTALSFEWGLKSVFPLGMSTLSLKCHLMAELKLKMLNRQKYLIFSSFECLIIPFTTYGPMVKKVSFKFCCSLPRQRSRV